MIEKKRILLIATGGTIASRPTPDGLSPQISPADILTCVPELEGFCRVAAVQLYNLDSTNMKHTHWIGVADCIRTNYPLFDGFVVTHGTDTMAYAAAALSYLVQKSRKPIVLTGSQRSIYEKDTDARENLRSAFLFAANDAASGVHLVFNGKVILGTRARKLRTKSFNAFSSIDYPEVAVIRGERIIHYINEKETSPSPDFYGELDPRVFVFKLIPGADPDILHYLKDHYRALVLESFGVGGIPFYESEEFGAALEQLILAGVTVVVTTQTPHEGSDMELYQVGGLFKQKYRLIEAYDMTIEATVLKLMWILPQTSDPAEIRRLFETPVCWDIY